ncbi:MAG: hypothetical protein KY464_02685 [Gemmatimonadetes bacterium]|nr:hypothetical protein [Gemmatimonadota bacterium]
MRARFDREVAEHLPSARQTAEEYLGLLTDLISTVEEGPVADPQLAGLDTTGSLKEAEELEAWAETERHRVRRALAEIR